MNIHFLDMQILYQFQNDADNQMCGSDYPFNCSGDIIVKGRCEDRNGNDRQSILIVNSLASERRSVAIVFKAV